MVAEKHNSVFFKSHEKDSIIRMLSAADQQSLFEPRQEKRVQLKTWPCHVLDWWVLKIHPAQAPSVSVASEGIFEKISHHFNGVVQVLVHKDKHYVKKLDADIRSTERATVMEFRALPCLVAEETLHLGSNRFHVWFWQRKRLREMEIENGNKFAYQVSIKIYTTL